MPLTEDMLNKLQSLINNDKYENSATALLDDIKLRKLNGAEMAENLFCIGRLYYHKEIFSAAKEFFLNALQVDRANLYSLFYLANIYEKEGDYKSAFMLYDRFSKETENHPQIIDYLLDAAKKIEFNVDNKLDFILSQPDVIKPQNQENKFPKISIILLCYNKVEFTKKCIASIFKNTKYPNYEIIAVDNASVDETPEYLETFGKRLKYVRINSNVGFIGGNNIGVSHSDAEYVLFLNNDTEVMPDWLNNLYNIFVYYPDAGGAGSKLIFANKKLQEAGGVIFNDATGWNYGRNGEIIDARYNFAREVDYCSGASLMVKRSLFNQLDGFDYRFAPAYFEDTDLCFGIRKLGYKIYYCPSSHVIHYEGVTNGTDVTVGLKRYQIINAPKFIEKWQSELALQYPNAPKLLYQFSNRKQGKRILIIDDIPPLPDRASGALRHYNTLKQLIDLDCQVTYAHMMGKQYSDEKAAEYFHDFEMQGVEFHWFNYESWWGIRNTPSVQPILKELIGSLELKARKFDFVYIAFWHIADYFIDLIRNEIPDTPVIIDSVDIHYLREQRRAYLLKDNNLLNEAALTKQRELALYTKSDCVLTVTAQDKDVLKKDLADKAVFVIPDVHDARDSASGFDERKDFIFVGNFNHNPNEDAVFYFVNEIFPLIKKGLTDVKFYIVGNNPTERITALSSDDIIVTGWVPEVEPYLNKCRVTVTPLRFGAGMKGKVGQSLSHGLPMVSTSIGAEGMNIINGVHSFITDDPKEFAQKAILLYTDKSLWESFSAKGKELISSQFSSAMMRKRLQHLLSFTSRKDFKTSRALAYSEPPIVSIILVTFNQFNYTKECIESVKLYTKLNYEIILIDNASSDDTIAQVKHIYPEIRVIANAENLGFPAAVNQGIKAAMGSYVLILNNDTVVTKGWLERLIDVAESDPHIGVVGPISNSVSGAQFDSQAKYSSIKEMELYAQNAKTKNAGVITQFPRLAFLCTLIKRRTFEELGGLDERFSPGNFEDDDYCLRAQLAGYKAVIAADVFIHHYGSKSFKSDGENNYAERLKINGEIFADKWGASPDEIWIKGKEFKTCPIKYPLNNDTFIEAFERAIAYAEEQKFTYANKWFKIAAETFHVSNRRNYKLDYPDVVNLAGNIALVSGELDAAKDYFSEELKLVPSSSRACAGLGEAFYSAGIFDSSKTMFEWGVKNSPSNKSAIEGLAKVNAKLGFAPEHNTLAEE
jgi:O-antigen biosynthesis protein